MIGGLFMRTTTRRLLAACATLAMLLSGLALSGCAQRALWSDEDTGAMRKLSYWDGQSVERERSARRNNADAGFGFSQGPADQ